MCVCARERVVVPDSGLLAVYGPGERGGGGAVMCVCVCVCVGYLLAAIVGSWE